ncbi:MAG: hypothetical protein ABJA82_02135 [Myxococcales bacterium]
MELEFARERELVHLRYELRRLLADGRREDAAPLLERLRQLAQAADGCGHGHGGDHSRGLTPDSARALPIDSEIARWATTFNL